MNYRYNCLNPIAEVGLGNLDDKYVRTEKFEEADAVFVRSAKMDELAPGANLLAVARAGAGVNNIPHAEYAKKGIVVFNTPGANANGVKELVLAGMLLASRDIVGGIEWVKQNVADPAINKSAEKAKKAFAGIEIQGKRLGVIGLGAIGQKVANAAVGLGMEVFGYDPYLSVDAAWNLDHAVKHCKNVETIYNACDFITIHVPALESTKGMINAETTYNAHHVGCCDYNVKVEPSFVLNLCYVVVSACIISACGKCLVNVVALSDNENANVLTCTVGENYSAANLLVSVT